MTQPAIALPSLKTSERTLLMQVVNRRSEMVPGGKAALVIGSRSRARRGAAEALQKINWSSTAALTSA